MRIAYLCSDIYVPVDGDEGCSVHVRELARAFVENGHEVTVFAGKLLGRPDRLGDLRVVRAEASGPDALTWPLLESEPALTDQGLLWSLWSLQSNSWLVDAATRFYAQQRPDLIYERYALFGCAGVELARRFNIPLVLEVNAPLRQEHQASGGLQLVQTAEAVDALVFRNADAIVAVSEWLRDWLAGNGADPGRVHVVPNAVADRAFAARPSGEAVRARFGLEGKRVVGFVGTFKPWHDAPTLLRAFHALEAEDADLRLFLVGGGSGEDGLKALARRLGIEGNVVFAGSVPHDEVPRHIAAMDVAVAPLRPGEEHLYFSPLKLFEYMAAGTPAVAAALGQAADIVEHGRTGWLYPPGDADKLAEGIATLLRKPGLAARIGEAARGKVLAEHTWRAVAARVTALAAAARRPAPERATAAMTARVER